MGVLSGATGAVRHTAMAVVEAGLVVGVVSAVVVAGAVATGAGPAGAKTALARGTTASVTITVPDGPFGGTSIATVSGGGGYWVHVVCATSSGTQMIDWEPTDANGQTAIALGPTPSWSSGTASCKADAGKFDRRGKFQVAGSTSFNIY